MARKHSALANKIKRMMQADEDVGKIAQQTPTVIGEPQEGLLPKSPCICPSNYLPSLLGT